MRRVTGDSFASSASEASEPEPETTPEPATEATTGSEQTTPSETAPPEPELAPPPAAPLPSPTTLAPPQDTEQQPTAIEDEKDKDLDSDSTIGAAREDAVSPDQPQEEDARLHAISRLPRRAEPHPTVAELVRKYQDFLSPQGVQDLAKTAYAPRIIVSESDHEYPAPIVPRNVTRDLAQ
ncbi:hypothetical protein BDZ89DRAFT_1138750 [Hymenopellis radicata]|nr:hypothetical protein BDZ89DRAFT_1138750 [Hymenopellis radicata]